MPDSSNSESKKLLLVDDEVDIRRPLAEVLESFSLEVREACSGKEALELQRKSPADVVLSDIRMPDGDGVFLLKSLRQEFGSAIPVLFMSGYADVTPERLFDLGADGLILKPFNLRAIVSTVNRVTQPPRVRWANGHQNGGTHPKPPLLSASFEFDAASSSKQFGLGRGGFFIESEQSFHRGIEEIRFNLEFKAGPIRQLEGWGRCLWTRGTYLGIEIFGLTPESLEFYVKWLEGHRPIALIPAAPGAL